MKFVKMQGAGNDYVYVDCLEEEMPNPNEVARRISDSHYGVGSDGLIIICPSERADFRMRMFNPDGSESQMCGNGIRCFAKFVYDRGLTKKDVIRVETLAGILTLDLFVEGGLVNRVRVNMGRPHLQRNEIPMKGPEGRVINEPFEVDGETYYITAVSMGNPHVVIFVDDTEKAPVRTLGPRIENHHRFRSARTCTLSRSSRGARPGSARGNAGLARRWHAERARRRAWWRAASTRNSTRRRRLTSLAAHWNSRGPTTRAYILRGRRSRCLKASGSTPRSSGWP